MPDLKTGAVLIGVEQFINTVGTVMIKRKKLKSEHFWIQAKQNWSNRLEKEDTHWKKKSGIATYNLLSWGVRGNNPKCSFL